MPLIVEDGTGKPDADSYISEADATEYWTDRNVTPWINATTQAREGALRMAADYLALAYRWPGQPVSFEQSLIWPRSLVVSGTGYFPTDAIPTQIITAQLLLALEAIGGRNILAKVTAEEQRQLIEETKSFKGMSKTLKYATAPVDNLSGLWRFPNVDNVLAGVAIGGSSSSVGVANLVRGI
jgi:hypothetical protein